jgi:16S rRNA (cytosine1402-N4)-methyltransferase
MTEPPRRRRVRYKGTHPRRFGEKYKELGGKADEVEKARARGATPAGSHRPVMPEAVIDALQPLAGATILDCTLGWGGHAGELAARAGSTGTVIGLDRDGEELERTEARLLAEGVRVIARHCNYTGAGKVLSDLGIDRVDALLADLGVSSMQLDRPDRGLSCKVDGPLDMRMDRSRGRTAAEWLEEAGEIEIAEALSRFGDEPDAKVIANLLARMAAEGRSPQTTGELAAAVTSAKRLGTGRFRKKDPSTRHPAARTFQALRMVVNRELEALTQLLRDLPWLVRPGGRVALLTFHSGEETLVNAALREQAAQGFWREAPGEPLKPAPEEVRANPRARSARLWRVVRT